MPDIPHDHQEFYNWCFRCQLHKDEIEANRAESLADAQAAWEQQPTRTSPLDDVAHDAFVAGYMAAEGHLL